MDVAGAARLRYRGGALGETAVPGETLGTVVDRKPAAGAERRHIPALDGLRGVAVLAVLLSHFYPEDRLPLSLLHFGRFGVVLFFALSGYLITGILLELRDRIAAGRTSWGRAFKSFYGRRALRILPAYLLALAICCLVGYAPVRSQLIWFLTYTVNFGQALGVADFGFADHFWSLAVEEQFYLVWPALMLAVPRHRLRGTILGLALTAAALNLAFAWGGATYLACFRLPFLGSLIPLSLGALLAEAEWVGKGGSVVRSGLTWAFLLAGLPLLAATQRLWFQHMARTSIFFLGFVDVAFSLLSLAALLALTGKGRLASGRLAKVFSWRPLAGIGKISYGIYVGHRLLMAFWPGLLARLGWSALPPVANLLVLSAIAMALAAVSWFLIEKPILSLKRLLPY
jgi:peptidoglycan/LPS O-acetylase OafA/YrhL